MLDIRLTEWLESNKVFKMDMLKSVFHESPDKVKRSLEELVYRRTPLYSVVTVTHVSMARRPGVAACAISEAPRRFLMLVAYLLNMATFHYSTARANTHIKIQAGILTSEPYQPAVHKGLMWQHQLDFSNSILLKAGKMLL